MMHLLAKEYGTLPSDLLRLTWAEYDFSVAVMVTALAELDPNKAKKRGRPSAAQLAKRTGR